MHRIIRLKVFGVRVDAGPAENRTGPVHIIKVPHAADGQGIVISVQVSCLAGA
jgi:hypothetical protein